MFLEILFDKNYRYKTSSQVVEPENTSEVQVFFMFFWIKNDFFFFNKIEKQVRNWPITNYLNPVLDMTPFCILTAETVLADTCFHNRMFYRQIEISTSRQD